VWQRRPEDHVARTYQLDFSLIGASAGRRAKRTNQDQANAFRVLRIRRNFDNVSVENDDLSCIKLASGARRQTLLVDVGAGE
jgi:hypothetical protein